MAGRPGTRRAALAAVLLVPVPLAACSGDGSAEGSGEPSPSGGASASVDPATVSPADLPDVPKVRRAQGAVGDVEFGECATDAGEQTVTGTVTNPGRRATDYAVTVSWTNDGSDVLARGVVVLEELAGGATEEFEVRARVPDAATTCTYFVQRGDVA